MAYLYCTVLTILRLCGTGCACAVTYFYYFLSGVNLMVYELIVLTTADGYVACWSPITDEAFSLGHYVGSSTFDLGYGKIGSDPRAMELLHDLQDSLDLATFVAKPQENYHCDGCGEEFLGPVDSYGTATIALCAECNGGKSVVGPIRSPFPEVNTIHGLFATDWGEEDDGLCMCGDAPAQSGLCDCEDVLLPKEATCWSGKTNFEAPIEEPEEVDVPVHFNYGPGMAGPYGPYSRSECGPGPFKDWL